MRINIEDIVEDIVLSIDKTIAITKIIDGDLTDTILKVCDFKWLVVGSVISDGTNMATVTAIDTESITITKDPLFTWTSKTLTIVGNLTFMPGTALAVNGEWQKKSNVVKNKSPFLWLVKPTREINNIGGQGIGRTSDLRLYFLADTLLKYKETEHTEKVIKPLWEWVKAFFDAIYKNKNFGIIDNYESREISRFGTESAQGFEANIIDANLSAIEVRFSLPVREGYRCLCTKLRRPTQIITDSEKAFLLEGNKILSFN